jgi:hypothetical protein
VAILAIAGTPARLDARDLLEQRQRQTGLRREGGEPGEGLRDAHGFTTGHYDQANTWVPDAHPAATKPAVVAMAVAAVAAADARLEQEPVVLNIALAGSQGLGKTTAAGCLFRAATGGAPCRHANHHTMVCANASARVLFNPEHSR